MSVAKKQTEARTLWSKAAYPASQLAIFNSLSRHPPGMPAFVDRLNKFSRLCTRAQDAYQVTAKTHSSCRDTTVTIGQVAQEVYSQRSVLHGSTVSGSHKMHIWNGITSSYAAIVFSTFISRALSVCPRDIRCARSRVVTL